MRGAIRAAAAAELGLRLLRSLPMRKVLIIGALTALFFLFTPATRAQDTEEVAKLRKENELLKKEIERLKMEIDLLKKEAKAQPDGAGDPKTSKELESLQGTWNIDTMEWGGKSLPKELMNGYKFLFAGNKLTWDAAIGIQSKGGKVTAIDGSFLCDFKIDPGKEPKQIDITLHLKNGDRTVLGIYEIKGQMLKVCYFPSNTGKRPAEFSTKDGLNISYIVLTRAKK
jgi:uncharacterized protein (TIGR03067 family)